MAPRPNATAAICTSSPASLPSTVISAARRPSTTPRLITNSTLGPGTTMMTNDRSPKAASRPGSGMLGTLAVDVRRSPRNMADPLPRRPPADDLLDHWGGGLAGPEALEHPRDAGRLEI